MKIQIMFVVILSILLLSGCGSDSGSGSKGGNNPNKPKLNEKLGYNPDDRWPEQGNYSYSFSSSINGVKCETEKSFKSQAAYCMGLQDAKLNDSCALSARKSSYQYDCGNDFQQINIPSGFFVSGYDSDLQMRCDTAQSSKDVFETEKDLCEFLKDESQHKNCFWERRLEEFQKWNCKGDFSEEPAVIVNPTPTPNPNSPQPTPTPVQEPIENRWLKLPIVSELNSHGIEVEVDFQALSDPRIGSGYFVTISSLDVFFSFIEKYKAQIIQRKKHIQIISPGILSSYQKSILDNKKVELSIDLELNEQEFVEVFSYLDQLILAKNQTNVLYSGHWGFISQHSSFRNSFEDIQVALQFMNNNKDKLKEISSIVKVIEYGTYANFSMSENKLEFEFKKPQQGFDKFYPLLKPMVPFFDWVQAQNVEIDFGLMVDSDHLIINSAFKNLNAQIQNIELMRQAGFFKVVKFEEYVDKVRITSREDFYVSMSASSQDQNLQAQVLQALGDLGKLKVVSNSSIQIDLGYEEFDQPKLNSLIALVSRWSSVHSKSNQILEIEFDGYATAYDSNRKTLRIANNATSADIQKALSEIR